MSSARADDPRKTAKRLSVIRGKGPKGKGKKGKAKILLRTLLGSASASHQRATYVARAPSRTPAMHAPLRGP